MEAEEFKQAKQTNLKAHEWNGRTYIGADLPWRGSPKIVARQGQFFDQILALAELPERDELPRILAVAQRSGISSIWRRVSPSLLENNAAALLTALAFSNRRDWVRLVRTFFKTHNLTPGLRGRPRLQHPTAGRDTVRGIQIDKLMAKLKKGFAFKLSAKKSCGFAGEAEQPATKLRKHGYNDKEIKAILDSKTLQDAGCRLHLAIYGEEDNVDLKGIRNSYTRYKSRSVRNSPSPL